MKQKEKTLSKEIRALIHKQYKDFVNWMRPSAGDPLWVQILKLVCKIPVFLFILAMSPVALIVLIFAFLAAF